MTPERWHQVTGIFHKALECQPADRAAFVVAQCGGDNALRQDVEALLAAHQDGGPLSGNAYSTNVQALDPGSRFGSFEVIALWGAGGMGEVYRARDMKLQRDVALKVLRPDVSTDPDRLARFDGEARALAGLNHPNIAHAYGLEEIRSHLPGQPATHALVMEFVDGPTLADRIASGPLPIAESLAIARQVADALEAAHERAIVHRDLKPPNIKVRPDGTVKVLDFGLAKALTVGLGRDGATNDATVAHLTEPGTIVGTAAYMAPEQAQGLPIDRRADMWAFGCVLFEMLTGQRLFDGESLPAVLLKIVGHEPDWSALPPDTPVEIRTLLRRCLEKEPKRRLDSAAAARIELEETLAGLRNARTAGDGEGSANALSPGLGARHATTRRLWPVAIGALVAAGVTAVFLGGRRSDPGGGPVAPRLGNAAQVTFSLGVENYPTWSPDGSRIAYHASDGGYGDEQDHDIWVSQIGRGDPINLTNGEGDNRMPNWSPDGQEIAFFSKRTGGWAVYTMPAIGGRPRQVLPFASIDATHWSAPQWSSDGSELHVSVSQGARNIVYKVSLASLEARPLDLPDHEGTVVWDLSLSPDGRRYAYVSGGGGQTEVTRLWTIPTSGGQPQPLTDGLTNVWSPSWAPQGLEISYISNRGGAMDLWQQAVHGDGTPAGEPVAVTRGVGIRSARFSGDGKRLAYSRGAWVSNVWRVPLLGDRPATWSDAQPITAEHAFVEFVDISPDGSQIALSSDRRGNQDLYVMASGGGEMTQLSTDPAPDWNPRWSPDGRQMVFYSARSGNRDIWVMPSSGGPARQLSTNPRRESEPSWSPDGSEILYRSRGPQGTWVVAAAGGDARMLAQGFSPDPAWSPEGWVLLAKQGKLYKVAKEGGTPSELPFAPLHRLFQTPRFSGDGKSLFYSVVSGPRADQNVWRLSLENGDVTQITRLEGRRGSLSYYFAVDRRYLYFTWREDEGDIWVMDVVQRGTADNSR